MIDLNQIPTPAPKLEPRWIIKLTMPSGAEFAASEKDGQFAMTPIINGVIINAVCWNDESDIKAAIEKFCEDPKGRKFFDELKAIPFKVLMQIDPLLQ